MRYFLTSCAAMLILACGSYPKKNDFQIVENNTMEIINPYFSDRAKDYVYKAKINLADKSFGGIFVVKKLGKDHHRVVFTTEMGNKLMDMSFNGADFKINYILPEIDKKILINLLRRDFNILIHERPAVIREYVKTDNIFLLETKVGKDTYFYTQRGKKLEKITRTRNAKEKTVYSFSGIDHDIAREIQIDHLNFKLSINLKSIRS